MKWNRMIRVNCPKTGKVVWANGHKVGQTDMGFRCTACDGEGHQKAA